MQRPQLQKSDIHLWTRTTENMYLGTRTTDYTFLLYLSLYLLHILSM